LISLRDLEGVLKSLETLIGVLGALGASECLNAAIAMVIVLIEEESATLHEQLSNSVHSALGKK